MATVTRGKTFNSGDTVYPADIHQLVDSATITFTTASDADDSTLEVSGNKFRVKDAGIVTAKLSDANVTTAKLANASVTPTKLSQPYTLATAQASTSGTAIDFTGIPSWVKRVTVMFGAVSLSGTENILLQIGSGSLATSGYVSTSSFLLGGSSSGSVNSSSGIVVYASSAANALSGAVTFSLLGSNTWVATGLGVFPNNGAQVFTAGRVALSGALDRLRVTNTAANTFDAGTISISYEG